MFAQGLAAEIQAAGGIVTAQDLEQAQPSIKQPITTKVRNLLFPRLQLQHVLTCSMPVPQHHTIFMICYAGSSQEALWVGSSNSDSTALMLNHHAHNVVYANMHAVSILFKDR